MEESLEEIAAHYNFSLASVHAAMAYYYDHREEIERHAEESEALVEEVRRNTLPFPLEERLKAIRSE